MLHTIRYFDPAVSFIDYDVFSMIQDGITNSNPATQALSSELARLVTLRSASLVNKDIALTAAVVNAASTQLDAWLEVRAPASQRRELVPAFGASAALQAVVQLLQEGHKDALTALDPIAMAHLTQQAAVALIAVHFMHQKARASVPWYELHPMDDTFALAAVHQHSVMKSECGRQTATSFLRQASVTESPEHSDTERSDTERCVPTPALSFNEDNLATLQKMLNSLRYSTGSWRTDCDIDAIRAAAALAVPWGMLRTRVWHRISAPQLVLPRVALLFAGGSCVAGTVLAMLLGLAAREAGDRLLFRSPQLPSLDRQVKSTSINKTWLVGFSSRRSCKQRMRQHQLQVHHSPPAIAKAQTLELLIYHMRLPVFMQSVQLLFSHVRQRIVGNTNVPDSCASLWLLCVRTSMLQQVVVMLHCSGWRRYLAWGAARSTILLRTHSGRHLLAG
ncbi:hypothetical protein JKP88DRAFT_252671 [Tribonema minus]|uniref:Uncharacterized protein n=1 Tax=Tribonema minus TaxID=303371 RepID=A0A836CLM9_9STRA|nr:hypothetical protein JKP88DRAFT_252671 [Tribonema minus]